MNRATDATTGLESSTATLRAFADPVRLRLLNLLLDDREVCVCHLHGALELPQPTVSRHLATLRQSGLVVGRKDGLWVHHKLARSRDPLARILLGCLGSTLGDPTTFAADLDRLDRVTAPCDPA